MSRLPGWTLGAIAAAAACGGEARGGPGEPEVRVPSVIEVATTPLRFNALGQSVTLAAQVRDQHGQDLPGVTILWESSDATVAKVTGGVVTSARNGTAQIRARYLSLVTGPVPVTVQQIAARMAIPDTVIVLGGLARVSFFISTLFDSLNYQYSSDRYPVLSLSGPGTTAMVESEVSIRSLAYGSSDTLVLTYVEGPVVLSARVPIHVRRTPHTVVVAPPLAPRTVDTLGFVGASRQLLATVFDAEDVAMANAPVAWTSSSSAVTASSTGLVTASSIGGATVAARSGAAVASRVYRVRRLPARMDVTPAAAGIATFNSTAALTVVAEDSGGTPLPVVWTVRTSGIVRLDSDTAYVVTATAVADGSTWVVAEAMNGFTVVGRDSALITVTNQPTVSFAADILPAFDGCTGCHGATAPAGGLSLTPAQAWPQLVSVPATADSATLRVAPGDPTNSYLIQRLEGTAQPRMPPAGGFKLGYLNLIRIWISEGAHRN